MDALQIESLISDLALILVLGAIATVIFKMLKQPMVLGYIVAGFIASPHFAFFPTVTQEANIEFWAQIGIIVLLFSLGLEFSFKKLLHVGGSAVITCMVIVLAMMGVGFVVGKILDFSAVDSIFLGGMISMSSTTIIIKALTDLNLRQRRFVPLVFAVLIVEDLLAVVMLVILSSIAINNRVEGGEMLKSILQLSFFLIMWFTVGVFMIPSIFNRFRRFISDELMLVIAMGLCFFMAVFSVKSGFSMALGAFVMGSILAGTSEAERIERIITPIKDFFGAVFFISVGMMVDPQVIVHYSGTIALLSVVVVVGMITFGTFGMLATGQPLKIAMESGFSLTQIGEFSFIIATTGMSLGVLEKSIYPIIVAVSVITTFFTPFFIKRAIPSYNWVAKHLPKNWNVLLDGYSNNAVESESNETKNLWKAVIQRYLLRLLLYSVIIIALILVTRTYWVPLVVELIPVHWGKLTAAISSFVMISPFLYAIATPNIKQHERHKLIELSGNVSYVPFVIMAIVSLLLTMGFTMAILYGLYTSQTTIISVILLAILIALLFSPILRKRISRIESRFLHNINERENRRTGKGNQLVSDLHLAYMRVGYGCPFVGEKLKNADIRKKYGVNLVNIQRNAVTYPVPTGEMRIFPGDTLGVIGNDEQIQHMLPLVEAKGEEAHAHQPTTQFTHFAITEKSPLVGVRLNDARLREDYFSLLVAIQRGSEYINPTPDVVFSTGDILWIVGDPQHLNNLR